jgi:hypothetical protein
MPDLGERGNVMGPQPIGKVVQPPPPMLAAAEHLLNAIMQGKRADVEAMTDANARPQMAEITNAVPAAKYAKFTLIGRARVAKHHFIKARLTGDSVEPLTLLFRFGADGERWTVREALNLTGRRSGWTK